MFTLNCKGSILQIDKPVVMGIINITPDSFFSGSRKTDTQAILEQAEKMLEEGATLLDIGGQSTNPSSELLSAGAELLRVLPAIEAIHNAFPGAYLSIDTFYSKVASMAVSAGASIINDISSGSLDPEMIPVTASLGVPYIAMHMKGTPQTMQSLATYENVTVEVLDFFIQKLEECRKAGINDVVADVGFGFAKTIAHNFTLLNNLGIFNILQRPLLAGLSRKATVYKTLKITPEEALNGTTVLNTIALLNGAKILRVHDVKEAMEAIKLTNILRERQG